MTAERTTAEAEDFVIQPAFHFVWNAWFPAGQLPEAKAWCAQLHKQDCHATYYTAPGLGGINCYGVIQ